MAMRFSVVVKPGQAVCVFSMYLIDECSLILTQGSRSSRKTLPYSKGGGGGNGGGNDEECKSLISQREYLVNY